MAVNYSTALKTTRMTAVVSAIGTSGKLELLTAADAILATITLDAVAGTVSGAVLTFSGFPKSAAATAAGTIAKARVRTSANADVVTGLTVGLSGSDINLDALAVSIGQTVNITSLTDTHSA